MNIWNNETTRLRMVRMNPDVGSCVIDFSESLASHWPCCRFAHCRIVGLASRRAMSCITLVIKWTLSSCAAETYCANRYIRADLMEGCAQENAASSALVLRPPSAHFQQHAHLPRTPFMPGCQLTGQSSPCFSANCGPHALGQNEI